MRALIGFGTDEMMGKLQMTFNRMRQATITNELVDIITVRLKVPSSSEFITDLILQYLGCQRALKAARNRFSSSPRPRFGVVRNENGYVQQLSCESLHLSVLVTLVESGAVCTCGESQQAPRSGLTAAVFFIGAYHPQ